MRFTYEIHQTRDRYAIVRRLRNGSVCGYNHVARINGEQRHFRIRDSWDVAGAIGDSRTYRMRSHAERILTALGGAA